MHLCYIKLDVRLTYDIQNRAFEKWTWFYTKNPHIADDVLYYWFTRGMDLIIVIWCDDIILKWFRKRGVKLETLSASLALLAGSSSITDEFSSQRPVTRSSDLFFDAPEQTVEYTIVTPVIWNFTVLSLTSL